MYCARCEDEHHISEFKGKDGQTFIMCQSCRYDYPRRHKYYLAKVQEWPHEDGRYFWCCSCQNNYSSKDKKLMIPITEDLEAPVCDRCYLRYNGVNY